MMWKILLPVLAATFAVGCAAVMVGGFRDADPNDEGVQNALNFAVVQHNRGSNDMFLRQVAEVVRVRSQVVAGIKYEITVKMAKTNCRKDSVNEVCAIHQDPEKAKPYQCTFTVVSRAWLHEIDLVGQTCV